METSSGCYEPLNPSPEDAPILRVEEPLQIQEENKDENATMDLGKVSAKSCLERLRPACLERLRPACSGVRRLSNEKYVTILFGLSILALVLSIIALSVASSLRSEVGSSSTTCTDGDVTWGQPVHEFAGHHYQLVYVFHGGITFPNALHDATTRCVSGQPGHLAVVDSEEENNFLRSLIPAMEPGRYFSFVAWLGSADTANEGEWAWVAGPDKGKVFWRGNGETGSPEEGAYSNWFCKTLDDSIAQDDFWSWGTDDMTWDHCEPNDYQNQDCLHMYGEGSWNDISCYWAGEAFFVEFE